MGQTAHRRGAALHPVAEGGAALAFLAGALGGVRGAKQRVPAADALAAQALGRDLLSNISLYFKLSSGAATQSDCSGLLAEHYATVGWIYQLHTIRPYARAMVFLQRLCVLIESAPSASGAS